jgi:hypothetical protein
LWAFGYELASTTILFGRNGDADLSNALDRYLRDVLGLRVPVDRDRLRRWNGFVVTAYVYSRLHLVAVKDALYDLHREDGSTRGGAIILWTILIILLILWLLGLLGGFGGNLIHVLLVIAVIVLIYNLVSGRRL